MALACGTTAIRPAGRRSSSPSARRTVKARSPSLTVTAKETNEGREQGESTGGKKAFTFAMAGILSAALLTTSIDSAEAARSGGRAGGRAFGGGAPRMSPRRGGGGGIPRSAPRAGGPRVNNVRLSFPSPLLPFHPPTKLLTCHCLPLPPLGAELQFREPRAGAAAVRRLRVGVPADGARGWGDSGVAFAPGAFGRDVQAHLLCFHWVGHRKHCVHSFRCFPR